jgi:hypothetical protein
MRPSIEFSTILPHTDSRMQRPTVPMMTSGATIIILVVSCAISFGRTRRFTFCIISAKAHRLFAKDVATAIKPGIW